jgi:hypothetical protein
MRVKSLEIEDERGPVLATEEDVRCGGKVWVRELCDCFKSHAVQSKNDAGVT